MVRFKDNQKKRLKGITKVQRKGPRSSFWNGGMLNVQHLQARVKELEAEVLLYKNHGATEESNNLEDGQKGKTISSQGELPNPAVILAAVPVVESSNKKPSRDSISSFNTNPVEGRISTGPLERNGGNERASKASIFATPPGMDLRAEFTRRLENMENKHRESLKSLVLEHDQEKERLGAEIVELQKKLENSKQAQDTLAEAPKEKTTNQAESTRRGVQKNLQGGPQKQDQEQKIMVLQDPLQSLVLEHEQEKERLSAEMKQLQNKLEYSDQVQHKLQEELREKTNQVSKAVEDFEKELGRVRRQLQDSDLEVSTLRGVQKQLQDELRKQDQEKSKILGETENQRIKLCQERDQAILIAEKFTALVDKLNVKMEKNREEFENEESEIVHATTKLFDTVMRVLRSCEPTHGPLPSCLGTSSEFLEPSGSSGTLGTALRNMSNIDAAVQLMQRVFNDQKGRLEKSEDESKANTDHTSSAEENLPDCGSEDLLLPRLCGQGNFAKRKYTDMNSRRSPRNRLAKSITTRSLEPLSPRNRRNLFVRDDAKRARISYAGRTLHLVNNRQQTLLSIKSMSDEESSN